MKTLVLKKSEMDKLPMDVQQLIIKVIEETEETTKSLKERVAALKYKVIDYRSDTNTVAVSNEGEKLTFDIWEKTNGEQWGNCSGTKHVTTIGRKYATVDCTHYHTGFPGSHWERQISFGKIDEIIRLLESAEQMDELDAAQVRIVAANRLASQVERF